MILLFVSGANKIEEKGPSIKKREKEYHPRGRNGGNERDEWVEGSKVKQGVRHKFRSMFTSSNDHLSKISIYP